MLGLLGPIVVRSTLAVLGTGVALLAVRKGSASMWALLHKASFIVWFVLMSTHVLTHLRQRAELAGADLRAGRWSRLVAGRRARYVAVAVALGIGLVAGRASLPAARMDPLGAEQARVRPLIAALRFARPRVRPRPCGCGPRAGTVAR